MVRCPGEVWTLYQMDNATMCKSPRIFAQMIQLSSSSHLLAVAAGSYFVVLQALSSSRRKQPSPLCNEGLHDDTRAHMSTYLQSTRMLTGDQPFSASIALSLNNIASWDGIKNAIETIFPFLFNIFALLLSLITCLSVTSHASMAVPAGRGPFQTLQGS